MASVRASPDGEFSQMARHVERWYSFDVMREQSPLAAADPAAVVYGRLIEPKRVVNEWAMRTRRSSPDAALRSSAWGLVASLDEFVALALTTLTTDVVVRPAEEPGVLDEAQAAEDVRLTVVLDELRNFRHLLRSMQFERLLEASRRRDPKLANDLVDRKATALERAGEWEKLLVFMGAGTEGDAHLAEDVIPAAPEDLPPGPSVSFDL